MLPRVSETIVLRRLVESDLADFQSYRNDPEVGRYQGWTPMSNDEAREFLAAMSVVPLLRPGEWTQIAIASPQTGRLVGDLGLFVAEDLGRAEIGFSLSRRFQGRGLATAAVLVALQLVFEQTPVPRIIAVTDARNANSIRLLERIGMSLVRADQAVFRGEPCTEYTYECTRSSSGV